jgi:hypothetical protein
MSPSQDTFYFTNLFRGRTDAIGIDRGGVKRRKVALSDYVGHLDGRQALGVFPMLDSNEVFFGAIDLDEPNFELAQQLQLLIPNPSFIERSRGGNAHVWVFFERPAAAWVVRAVLRGATESIGRPDVEIFPKQDRLKDGMVGNYINLPAFGNERPILDDDLLPISLPCFLGLAWESRHDPEVWERRARQLGAKPPEEREAASEFGTQEQLHRCARYIIDRKDENPIRPGARHQVAFHLSKMLLNWRDLDQESAFRIVREVNDASERPLPYGEVERAFSNALHGQWTSTGCDDPVLSPYVDPTCPIANG